jgi:cyclopropane fatty-acyl-phospholipid synthase-like methyltransferase
MTNEVAERLVWAMETLAVDPGDHLLEIGCGHGVAVSLVCERLKEGTITAIDRSAKMIAMAERRNRPYVAMGRAAFAVASLADADLGDARFDKIFAVNVGLFRAGRTTELETIRRHLAIDGALYLFHQDPWVARTPTITDTLTELLTTHGFATERVPRQEMEPLAMNCVVARLSRCGRVSAAT